MDPPVGVQTNTKTEEQTILGHRLLEKPVPPSGPGTAGAQCSRGFGARRRLRVALVVCLLDSCGSSEREAGVIWAAISRQRLHINMHFTFSAVQG